MPSSPRSQLENIISRKKPNDPVASSAQYVLDHPEWLTLMKDRQSYFRDFILSVVSYTREMDVEDSQVIAVLQEMCDSGYMWEAFNAIKQYGMPRSIATSIESLLESDVEVTSENVKPVHVLYTNFIRYRIGSPYIVSRTSSDEQIDTPPLIDPRLVREVVERPISAHLLIGLMESGYDSVDTVLELNNMAREHGTALREGLL